MSEQGTLDLFAPEPIPVSAGWREPSPAPIAPSADLTAKHCSSMGALAVEPERANLWRRMLAMYRIAPRTDMEMAALLQVQRSTINARRAELIAQGKVDPQSCGTRKNPKTGISNSLWQLRKDA